MCGTTNCDAAMTGLFCYAPQNLCADYANPRKVHPVVTSGTCASNGYGWIEDLAACGAAARQVGWSDLTANSSYNGSDDPRGCIANKHSNRTYFNTNTSSQADCNGGVSKACLCAFRGPACAHVDGATENPAPCVCGDSEACNSFTGLFCNAGSCSRARFSEL